jgi:hypothetical protein
MRTFRILGLPLKAARAAINTNRMSIGKDEIGSNMRALELSLVDLAAASALMAWFKQRRIFDSVSSCGSTSHHRH